MAFPSNHEKVPSVCVEHMCFSPLKVTPSPTTTPPPHPHTSFLCRAIMTQGALPTANNSSLDRKPLQQFAGKYQWFPPIGLSQSLLSRSIPLQKPVSAGEADILVLVLCPMCVAGSQDQVMERNRGRKADRSKAHQVRELIFLRIRRAEPLSLPSFSPPLSLTLPPPPFLAHSASYTIRQIAAISSKGTVALQCSVRPLNPYTN